jgi:hypothetical protein
MWRCPLLHALTLCDMLEGLGIEELVTQVGYFILVWL